MPPSLHRHLAVTVALTVLLTACASGDDGGTDPPAGGTAAPTAPTAPTAPAAPDQGISAAQPVPDADDIDPARLEPLARLGACPDELPPPAEGADPGDVPLPPEAIVTSASQQGSLRNVQGYSPRTPVEIMVEYLREQDVTAVTIEDEVFESEVLLERGDLRVFVKSQATCERGSAFVLFASDDPALVPAPTGAAP